MALDKRDWWMLAIGLGIGFFVFSTLGKKTMLTAMGVGTSEATRLLNKIEKKSKERAKR